MRDLDEDLMWKVFDIFLDKLNGVPMDYWLCSESFSLNLALVSPARSEKKLSLRNPSLARRRRK